MLTLTIKKKWYDMILKKEKKEEYRELKHYYHIRLKKFLKNNDTIEIKFRNGYSLDSPCFISLCKIRIGKGKTEWGAEENKLYYVLDILAIK